MMKTIKRLITTLSLVALFAVPVLTPALAHAQVQVADVSSCLDGSAGGITGCTGSGAAATDPNGNAGVDPSQKVNDMIKLVINVFSLVVGVISVIMIIIGGLKYITSGGDSGNVSGAKNTILYAIIGLVVVALAQIIVQFVLAKVTNNS